MVGKPKYTKFYYCAKCTRFIKKDSDEIEKKDTGIFHKKCGKKLRTKPKDGRSRYNDPNNYL